jgi:hypothetical protein
MRKSDSVAQHKTAPSGGLGAVAEDLDCQMASVFVLHRAGGINVLRREGRIAQPGHEQAEQGHRCDEDWNEIWRHLLAPVVADNSLPQLRICHLIQVKGFSDLPLWPCSPAGFRLGPTQTQNNEADAQ